MMAGAHPEVAVVPRRPFVPRVVLAFLLLGPGTGFSLSGEAARIDEALALRAGMHVADVGAGDGEWTEHLARTVGAGGRVYATEVDTDELEKIERRVKDAGLGNVTTVLGAADRTGLEGGCCDAILLRMVYHHFTDPPPMRASLRQALRPGARLAVIDIEPQRSWRHLPGVPERGGHGIPADALVAEMTADGFEVVARHEAWNGDAERYCVVFRRASPRAGS